MRQKKLPFFPPAILHFCPQSLSVCWGDKFNRGNHSPPPLRAQIDAAVSRAFVWLYDACLTDGESPS